MRGYERDELLRHMIFNIQYMANNLVVQLMGDLSRFKPIDAMPQFTATERKSIEDFRIFATPLVRTQELLVDPNEIGSILEKIKQAQLPEQEAIRARNRLRDNRIGYELEAIPQQKFHAQILSIVA